MPGKFKKRVCESTLTKLEKEMRFVNAKPAVFPDLGKQDFGGRGKGQMPDPYRRLVE